MPTIRAGHHAPPPRVVENTLYTSPPLCYSFVEAVPPYLPNLVQDSGWRPAKSKLLRLHPCTRCNRLYWYPFFNEAM